MSRLSSRRPVPSIVDTQSSSTYLPIGEWPCIPSSDHHLRGNWVACIRTIRPRTRAWFEGLQKKVLRAEMRLAALRRALQLWPNTTRILSL
jgi:hypothetical protein